MTLKGSWTVCLIALILLSGCSSIDKKPPLSAEIPKDFAELKWPERWRAIQAVTQWTINGKIGVRGPDSADSAVIDNWQQRGENFDITLSSPILGLGKTTLRGSNKFLSIESASEGKLHSTNPEAFLNERTGWLLPLKYIPYWAKAIPKPGTAYHIKFDGNHNPVYIEQEGWIIKASRYRFFQGIALPGKVKLSRANHKVTLIINDWKIN